jgi:hypothetical protein
MQRKKIVRNGVYKLITKFAILDTNTSMIIIIRAPRVIYAVRSFCISIIIHNIMIDGFL